MRTTIAVSTAFLCICLSAPATATPLTTSERVAAFEELRSGDDQTTATAAAAPNVAPDELLQRGEESYRGGRYAAAIHDLRAASDAFLTPQQMR